MLVLLLVTGHRGLAGIFVVDEIKGGKEQPLKHLKWTKDSGRSIVAITGKFWRRTSMLIVMLQMQCSTPAGRLWSVRPPLGQKSHHHDHSA
jgi:hypothetical protein